MKHQIQSFSDLNSCAIFCYHVSQLSTASEKFKSAQFRYSKIKLDKAFFLFENMAI